MSKYAKIKKRVYEIIGPTQKGDTVSGIFDVALCALVILSSVAVVIELLGVPDAVQRGLEIFELATVGVFILEYLVRLWVCDLEYPECKNKFEATKEFVTSFDSLIDIISIVSILFNQIPKELAFLRLVKLVKLVRLVKMSDYIKTSDRYRTRMDKIKQRVHQVIEKDEDGDKLSKAYDITSVVLILLSVSFILLETFPISVAVHNMLFIFEVIIASLFAVEYVLRVWTAPLEYPDMRPDKARMRYIFSFMSLIDILSIFPVFIANLSTATGILKIFKLCKILRLVKTSRYISGVANFGKAIQAKKKQIILSVVSIVVMIMICSVLMYSFESQEQPDVFTNGFSGLIYCVQVMVESDTELAPVTAAGQALSTVMMLLGGCMFGVPIAIVATGFEDMISEQAGEEENREDAIYDFLKEYDSFDDADKKKISAYISADRNNAEDGE
ncbi:MAG: ion transporter [Clostridia bacterium]|nr:ion transporter [Clostridia bacterium]